MKCNNTLKTEKLEFIELVHSTDTAEYSARYGGPGSNEGHSWQWKEFRFKLGGKLE